MEYSEADGSKRFNDNNDDDNVCFWDHNNITLLIVIND